MARIDIKSAGATLNDGVLQLENGVAMDTTLRNVADQNNTTSPLKLSTTAVQVVSPFRITTDDPSDMYLDCEDGSANNRFNITRNTASQQVNLNFASNPAGSTTTVGAIRTFTDGVNLGEVVKFREDGQVTFTERVNVEADSLVTTQSSSVIAASTTNANLVIAPNGTGALVASVPDGTATGGNARGIYAVDLQTIRTLNTQVASANASCISGGNSNSNGVFGGFIGGGLNNFLANNGNVNFGISAIVGGINNRIGSDNFPYKQSFIGGGNSNLINAEMSTICGGSSNTVSSASSTISGGQSNTASTNTHATVVGGSTNTSSGQYSVSGGVSCVASGKGSLAIGTNDPGAGNTASGIGAVALGGRTTASGNYSFTGGSTNITNNGVASLLYGESNSNTSSYNATFGRFNSNSNVYNMAFGQGTIAAYRGALSFQSSTTSTSESDRGIAQSHMLTMQKTSSLNTGASTILFIDGVSAILIPYNNNTSWNVQVRWVAVVTAITGTATGVTVGDTKTSTDLLAVARRSGTTTVSAHTSAGTSVIETLAGSLTTANITYSAGASQEMTITFTGPTFAGGGSVTMRVVAAISLTEVAY